MGDVTSDIAATDIMGNNRAALANMQRGLNGSATLWGQPTGGTITAPKLVKAVGRVTVDDFDIPTIDEALDTDFDDLLGLLLFDESGNTSVTTSEVGLIVRSGFININTSFAAGDYLWISTSAAGSFTDVPVDGQPPVAKVLVTGASGLMLFNAAGLWPIGTQKFSCTTRLAGLTATSQRFLFIAPYADCKIIQAKISSSSGTTSDGSNNWSFQIQNLTQAEALLSTAKSTNGAEISADTAYLLNPDQNQLIDEDDVIEFQATKTGSPGDLTEAMVQIEYMPGFIT
jgi:hypothetical protein